MLCSEPLVDATVLGTDIVCVDVGADACPYHGHTCLHDSTESMGGSVPVECFAADGEMLLAIEMHPIDPP